jgi:vitamin B12 transporter
MRHISFRSRSLAGLGLILSAHAAAMPARGADILDPIIVTTATRTAVTADETLAPVTIITREDIERTPAVDVADLLNTHANIDVARNGGFGQPVATFIRGANSSHTLVLVDGVRINPGTIGLAALQNIDPAHVERIEVVRGPRSALYGSDAIGGVINVITREPSEGGRWDASVGAGNHGARSGRASVGGAQGPWRGGVSVSHFEADGYPVVSDAETEHGHRNTSFNARAGVDLGVWDVDLNHWQAEGRTEYWSFGDLSQDFLDRVTALTGRYGTDSPSSGLLRVTYQRSRIDQNDGNFLGDLDHAHTTRIGVEWQHDHAIAQNQLLTLGIGWEREEVDALSFGTRIDERNHVRSGFIQHDLEAGPHRVIGALRVTDHDAFGSRTTGNLDYGYRLSSRWRLTAGAGTAYRAPDNTDRFGFGGNPDLRPETSRSVEAGVRFQPAPGTRWRAVVFENRIRDLIIFDGTRMENVERARITGLEVSVDHRAGPWRSRAELVWQTPRNETRDERLPRRARERAAFTLAYDQGRSDYQVQVVAVGGRKDSSFSDETLSGYSLLNLSAGHRLSGIWMLRGTVENLLDRDYETAAGYPARGRFVMLTLSAGGGL